MHRSAVACLFLAACGPLDPPLGVSDTAVDAAQREVGLDANSTPDSTTRPDAGPAHDTGTTTDTGAAPDMGGPGPDGPTRYLAGPLVQPITASVVDTMRGIRARSATPDDDVFIKVGASGTVNLANLSCFGPTSNYRVDLDGRDELQPTIDRFNQRRFGTQAAWDRTTAAAEVGRTASWVQAGSPAPIDQEIAALNPRFALVNYGTNDMQQGITHATALWPFYANMVSLLDHLDGRGIVPIVTGLNPRSDTATAALWVPTYDAVTRALAESRQLPYLDLYLAAKDLANRGLISDGIHGNAYSDGGSQPCDFGAAGLAFNYNVRNLLTLQLLHDVTRTVLDDAMPPASNPRPWVGDGTPGAPVIVDALPFSHHDDTSMSATSARDDYPGCDSGQNESGPEIYYALELTAPTALRIMLFDGAADIDIHLLQGSSCVARHDRMIEGTFGPGAYTIVADTFVSGAGVAQSGNFSLVIVTCEPGDPDCL